MRNAVLHISFGSGKHHGCELVDDEYDAEHFFSAGFLIVFIDIFYSRLFQRSISSLHLMFGPFQKLQRFFRLEDYRRQ